MTVARVATFEGGTAEGIRAAAEEIRGMAAESPPEGVKSTGLTMLIDPDGGRVTMLSLFANEDDLRESEAALSAMNPPEGTGSRTSVSIYEVAVDLRV